MKTKSSLSRKLLLAFGAAILVLLTVGVISYRAASEPNESDHWVRHTHEVPESLQAALSAIRGAETAARGFVLTGDESYIETYKARVLQTQGEETILRNLTVDNPVQQRQIPLLVSFSNREFQLAEAAIAIRRAKGLDATVEFIRDEDVQQVMVDFQHVADEMRDEEQRLLILRNADASRRLAQTKTILIIGTVPGLLILTAAGWSARRDSSKRSLAEFELRESEEKYRKLIQGVKDYAILMLGPRDEIRSWNSGAERMTGCTFQEANGQDYPRFFLRRTFKTAGRERFSAWLPRTAGMKTKAFAPLIPRRATLPGFCAGLL